MPINADQCQSMLINVSQWRSMPINGDHCRSTKIDINADQCRSMPINADQCRSMSINVDQCRSMSINARSILLDLALIGIDRHWSELREIERNWSALIGNDRNWSALGSMPEFWSVLIGIDRHWAMIEGVLISFLWSECYNTKKKNLCLCYFDLFMIYYNNAWEWLKVREVYRGYLCKNSVYPMESLQKQRSGIGWAATVQYFSRKSTA